MQEPIDQTHVFQPPSGFRAVVQVRDFGTSVVVNVEFSGRPNPRYVAEFNMWYQPILDRCYEVPSTTYMYGMTILTWPQDGMWITTVFDPAPEVLESLSAARRPTN